MTPEQQRYDKLWEVFHDCFMLLTRAEVHLDLDERLGYGNEVKHKLLDDIRVFVDEAPWTPPGATGPKEAQENLRTQLKDSLE